MDRQQHEGDDQVVHRRGPEPAPNSDRDHGDGRRLVGLSRKVDGQHGAPGTHAVTGAERLGGDDAGVARFHVDVASLGGDAHEVLTLVDLVAQPMEERRVTVSRAHGSLTFPAGFVLVAAMNP